MCKQVEVLLVMPVVGDCARCVPGVLISCCAAVVVFYRQRLSRTSGQHRVAVFQNYATRPGGHPAVSPQLGVTPHAWQIGGFGRAGSWG